MSYTLDRPVIVGVDGSRRALGAARWATEWCARTRSPIRLVYAVPDDVWFAAHDPFAMCVDPALRREANTAGTKVLTEALAAAREVAPDLDIATPVYSGTLADHVAEYSSGASMVVIGSTRSGPIRDVLLGSQVMGVIRSSSCPVLAWREDDPADSDRDGLVVGYDSSPHADRALTVALHQARALGEELTVAYYFPAAAMIGAGYALNLVNWSLVEQDGIARLRRRIAPACEQFPEVDVDIVYGDSSAARGLVGASSSARLLIVGSRGMGSVAGTFMGSVSQNLVHHARCPVLVVP
ncbi:universal stress protein [Gordonia sp. PS3]|uniref:universal stress protein n=1 Tax=Gordonia sp. PS3 TaxID=3248841 RepID=UPI0035C25D5D